ncbi:MAG: hypothetical protein AB1540_15260 [Bdellovibrionota bacterium]
MRHQKKINDFSGELWLLENDPSLSKRRKKISNTTAYASRLARFRDRSCGCASLDSEMEDGSALIDFVPAQEEDEIEGWRMAELSASFEGLLAVFREGGTSAVSKVLGCSQRSVQMKLKALTESKSGPQDELKLF